MGDKPSEPTDDITASYSIITIGDAAVGKTSLTSRFFKNEFSPVYLTTIGVDNTSKKIEKGDKKYLITVWDTTGQERFTQLAKQYLRKANGVFFVFSYENKNSLLAIKKWLDILKNANTKQSLCFALLGNKADLEDNIKQVTKEDGEKLAQELNMPFYDVSAKTGHNVNLSFNTLIDSIIEANQGIAERKGKTINQGDREKKKKCC